MTTQQPETSPPPALLSLLQDSSCSTIIKQGAEAKVYKSVLTTIAPTLTVPCGSGGANTTTTELPPVQPILLKYRFPKQYRHPTLTQSITMQRTVSEVRALVRCAKRKVNVPRVKLVDEHLGIIGLEWIDGKSVRELLGGGAEDDEVPEEQATDDVLADSEQQEQVLNEQEQLELMSLVGYQLARMHSADVIHGDLTTSNMMLRDANPRQARQLSRGTGNVNELVDSLDTMKLSDGTEKEVLLIDFGLSLTSPSSEDKAVDLYVLERAFKSTHPHSEHLFTRVMESYGDNVDSLWKTGQWRVGIGGGGSGTRGGGGKKKQAAVGGAEQEDPALSPWRHINAKLKDVRMRGRKRSMVG